MICFFCIATVHIAAFCFAYFTFSHFSYFASLIAIIAWSACNPADSAYLFSYSAYYCIIFCTGFSKTKSVFKLFGVSGLEWRLLRMLWRCCPVPDIFLHNKICQLSFFKVQCHCAQSKLSKGIQSIHAFCWQFCFLLAS